MKPLVSLFFSVLLFLIAGGVEPALGLTVKDGRFVLNQLRDYDSCQAKDYSGESCHEALVQWVKDHPNDAFQAGKLTRQKMNASAAMEFFAQAFEQKKGNCKDDDVRLAVISALNLPGDAHVQQISQAKKIGIETCFAEMKAAILESASLDSYTFKNTCKELTAKGALTGLKRKKCESM
jgi:hypothetical protein